MAVGSDGRWDAAIGDPTVIGWVTVGFYAVATLPALGCARRAALPLECCFWALATLVLVFLTAFIVLRGVSFHCVDRIVGSIIQGIRYNWILELTPLTLFIFAAWRRGPVDAAT